MSKPDNNTNPTSQENLIKETAYKPLRNQKDNIVRIYKDENYFVASNVPFNDDNLSWEARGVMAYFLSKPNYWEIKTSNVINSGPAGKKKVQKVMRELEDNGYLYRQRCHDEDGNFYWEIRIFEVPELQERFPFTQP